MIVIDIVLVMVNGMMMVLMSRTIMADKNDGVDVMADKNEHLMVS